MLTLDVAILSVAIVVNLFLGLLTFLKNPKSTTNLIFFLFTLSIILYLFLNNLALTQTSDQMTLLYIRMVMCIALMINLLYFLFVLTFPHSTLQVSKRNLFFSLLATGILLPLTMTDFIFKSVVPSTTQPVPGNGIIFFLLHTVIFLGLGFYILIRKYKRATDLEKVQLRFLVTGTIFMFVSIFVTNFLFVLFFKTTAFVGFLPLYTLIFVGFVSYSIVRHRFLDIRLIVARSVAYTLLIILLVLAYSVVLFTVSTYITGVELRKENLFSSVILTLIVAFSLSPLKQIFERVTSSFLYKDMYSPNKLLREVSHTVAASLELETLGNGIFSVLSSEMKVNNGLMILTRDDKLVSLNRYGISARKTYFQQDLIYLLQKTIHQTGEKIAVFEELPEGKEKEIMRTNDITMVIPLKVKHKIVGALFLGDKASGDIYSAEDISVLSIIAPEIAIGVKNALAYEEIKKFNSTLKEEVRHATVNLKRANERLKELDELKDEFVSLASHELRTPMTAVKSYIWMVINQMPKSTSPQIKKYLDISYQSTERLIQLVNEMLTVSRIERNKIDLHMERINIKEIFESVYEELKVRADEQKIGFTVQAEQDKLFVTADKDKLREVFQNIVGNALKFTPEGGKISALVKKHEGSVYVSVTDTGPGIAKENLSKLFQKFSKIDYSYSKKADIHGTGLGLYISKQIISLHHGDIVVESQVDVGTTFTVVLPVHQTHKG